MVQIKRYAGFSFNFNADGGWLDFVGLYDDLDQANLETRKRCLENNQAYYHVVDLLTLEIVINGFL